MSKIDPKQYTKSTIKTASGKRITKVLQRYWKVTNDKLEEDKTDEKIKIFEDLME